MPTKIRISDRYKNLMLNLQTNDCVIFKPQTNGDLGALKVIENKINNAIGYGKFNVKYDRTTKQGAIITFDLTINKKKRSKNVFFFG